MCNSAECEARRIQKEQEREEALQQRLRHAAEEKHRQLNTPRRAEYTSALSAAHVHLAAAGDCQSLSRSESLKHTADAAAATTLTTHDSPDKPSLTRSSSVNNDSAPSRTPARAPTLKQAASAGNNSVVRLNFIRECSSFFFRHQIFDVDQPTFSKRYYMTWLWRQWKLCYTASPKVSPKINQGTQPRISPIFGPNRKNIAHRLSTTVRKIENLK